MGAPMVPNLDDRVAGPFWQAANEQRLVVQRCDACGHLRWPPLSGCPDCLDRSATWVDVAGTGRIWSFAVYHRALHPAFGADVPYVIAVIELDEGPLMTARYTGPAPLVNDQVEVFFESLVEGVTIPRFRPRSD